MSDEKQQPEEQGKEAKKIEGRYQTAMRRLTALAQDDKWFTQARISREDLPGIMQRLTQTKKDELFKKFETGFLALMEETRQYNKTTKALQKEFENTVLNKKKEFVSKMETLLTMVDQIEGIEKEYFDSLSDLQSAQQAVSEQSTDQES